MPIDSSLLEFLRTPTGTWLLFNVLAFWPAWRVLKRAGQKPYWAVLVFLPLIGTVLVMAVLALARWPAAAAKAE